MAARKKKTVARRKKTDMPLSYINRDTFYLKTKEEEHGALLFASGVVFGIAIIAAIYKLWYPFLATLVVLIVLWLIETRQ
jgi:hypothetical protein